MKRAIGILSLSLLLVLAFSCKRKEPEPKVFESVMLRDRQLDSRYLEDSVARYNIYLPKDYATSGKTYPVLYLFHGVMDDHSAWTAKGNVKSITDKAVKEGIIEPFIIVMPDGFNCFYVNGAKLSGKKREGNDWESYFWKELKPMIEKKYPVRKGKANTAIAGNSMGGYGAVYHAFNYPGRFSFCYSMSGALDGMGIFGLDKAPSLKAIFKKKGYDRNSYGKLPEFIMESGKGDIVCGGFNDSADKFLESVEFPHEFRKLPGGHNWEFWKESYERMLPDLAKHFGSRREE